MVKSDLFTNSHFSCTGSPTPIFRKTSSASTASVTTTTTQTLGAAEGGRALTGIISGAVAGVVLIVLLAIIITYLVIR